MTALQLPNRHLYAIKPVGLPGPIKLGCSMMPETRLRALAAWSPIPLEIVARVPGTTQDEAALHELLRADRTHGEWHRPSSAVQGVVRSMAQGQPPRAFIPDRFFDARNRTRREPVGATA